MPARSIPRLQKPPGLPWVLFWILVHIPLAVLFHQINTLATIHAVAVIGLGFYWALFDKRIERIAYVAAYITGSEVLWRMVGASVFWETGKYAVTGIFLLAMLRRNRFNGPELPLFYILLLLPSAVLTFFEMSAGEARGQLSFNLSGPLAIFMCAWFFSKMKLQRPQLTPLLLALIAPIVATATVAAFGILSNANIKFVNDSNFATSGGFGPNQVSAILGFGALAALFCLLDKTNGIGVKLFLFGVLVALMAQSAMTFSRGGLYNAAGAAIVALFFILRNPRARVPFLVAAVGLFVVVNYVVFPRLDTFTGGALVKRFQDTGLTSRDKIAREDLELFAENPILGVGVGVGKLERNGGRDQAAAHTEFTRLLAEHGLFGACALIFLLVSVFGRLRRAPPENKAFVAAMLTWSCLFMLNAGMRLVAPAMALGLCFISWVTIVAPATSAETLRGSRLSKGANGLRRRPKNFPHPPRRLASPATKS